MSNASPFETHGWAHNNPQGPYLYCMSSMEPLEKHWCAHCDYCGAHVYYIHKTGPVRMDPHVHTKAQGVCLHHNYAEDPIGTHLAFHDDFGGTSSCQIYPSDLVDSPGCSIWLSRYWFVALQATHPIRKHSVDHNDSLR